MTKRRKRPPPLADERPQRIKWHWVRQSMSDPGRPYDEVRDKGRLLIHEVAFADPDEDNGE